MENKHLRKIVIEYAQNLPERMYKNELLRKTRDIKFLTTYHKYYGNDCYIVYSRIMDEWLIVVAPR
jgi:hypothetical protein